MTIELKDLNANQIQAVSWQDGPLLVLAGPGSGKTRVLTYRIVRLLKESAGERFRILGITFTNKAASEMRSRIETLLTEGRERALLTTFHSFAAEILRQHGSHVGLRPDFVILSQEADREAMLSEAVKQCSGIDEEYLSNAKNVLPIIDRLLAEGLAPPEAREALKGYKYGPQVAELFQAYRAKLIEKNTLDFGALIATAVQLLKERPAVAKQLQRVYRYVCVDEFQDTNGAQYRLLVSLVPQEKANLFVVADDDQLIYQWNGADPKRLRDLIDRFRMQTIQLPENYRCPPEVISVANQLISHNGGRSVAKEALKARKSTTGADHLRVFHFEEFNDEADWIIEELKNTPAENRADCAVLARTKKLLDRFVERSNEKGLSACIAQRKSEFISGPFSWLHALLRLANARQDREQVRRLCKAFYSMEGVNMRVEDVVSQSSFYSGDYLRCWLNLAQAAEGISPASKEVIERTKQTLLERADHWAFIEAALGWFDKIKARLSPDDRAFDEYDQEKAVWEMLQREVIQQYGKNEVTLHAFLQELDLRSKEAPPPENSVRCLTIHTAKGLEFNCVYLMGLVEEQLPSWAAVRKGDDSLEMQEERRNCFVAITRCEEKLTLTFAKRYFGYSKAPSRFLAEMGIGA